MNLLIEGCDCVGKTSTIRELQKLNPQYNVVKCNAPKNKQGAMAEYVSIVNDLQTTTHTILDRGMLSECVYAPIFRGYYPEYMRTLELDVPKNTALILLTCHPEEIKRRFDGEFITENQIPNIQKRFVDEFIKSYYPRKLLLDTTRENPQQIARTIESMVREW